MKRTVKSQKRTKFLLVLIVLTAILSITATYAWFSMQRDVEIVGMRLNVEVAESMQISLDGETWVQSISIADMRQFYGSYTGTQDGFTIYQAPTITKGNANYVPTELKPVSSAGQQAAGRLQFVTGDITANGLESITLCTETDLAGTTAIGTRQDNNNKHPYLTFDMYLRNISKKTGSQVDILKLNAGSNVYINTDTTDDTQTEGKGVANTGLEYSARVGFIVYGNTVSTSATDTTTTVDPDGEGGEDPVTTTLTVGDQVRALAATGTEVPAIWEPNSKNHTAYVVTNDSRVATATSEVTTYAIKKEAAASTEKKITNPNATSAKLTVEGSETEVLEAVNTFKPEYDANGVKTATEITNIGGTDKLSLKPNTMSKVRVYVWLEGQDPDCVDLASTGDKLNITIKLTKDQTTDGAGLPSYAS